MYLCESTLAPAVNIFFVNDFLFCLGQNNDLTYYIQLAVQHLSVLFLFYVFAIRRREKNIFTLVLQ